MSILKFAHVAMSNLRVRGPYIEDVASNSTPSYAMVGEASAKTLHVIYPLIYVSLGKASCLLLVSTTDISCLLPSQVEKVRVGVTALATPLEVIL